MRYDLIIRKNGTPEKIIVLHNELDMTLISWEYRMKGYEVEVIESK